MVFQAEKLTTILKAAGVSVEPYWPSEYMYTCIHRVVTLWSSLPATLLCPELHCWSDPSSENESMCQMAILLFLDGGFRSRMAYDYISTI